MIVFNRFMRIVLICAGLFFLSTPVCPANIYSWTDDKGIRHFSNVAPDQHQDVQILREAHPVFKGNPFQVVKIYDGDTILVTGMDLEFKIRLVGIDSPETEYGKRPDQPYGLKAKQFLTDLLNNQTVTLISYGSGGYNRQLAEVFVRSENINLKMIKAGLAEVYRGRRPAGLDSGAYFKAEKNAIKEQKGMWRQGDRYISPFQWRKKYPIK